MVRDGGLGWSWVCACLVKMEMGQLSDWEAAGQETMVDVGGDQAMTRMAGSESAGQESWARKAETGQDEMGLLSRWMRATTRWDDWSEIAGGWAGSRRKPGWTCTMGCN